MAALGDLLDGLEARLKAIAGLRVYPELPGSIQAPAAVVSLGAIDYDATMDRESDDIVFHVRLFTSSTSERAGQRALFAYLDGSGAKSVKAAIEADPTLGGAAMFAEVRSAGEISIARFADAPYYSVELVVGVGVAG